MRNLESGERVRRPVVSSVHGADLCEDRYMYETAADRSRGMSHLL